MLRMWWLALLAFGNIVGLGGATTLAAVGGFDFRGIIPASILLLTLDVWAIRSIFQKNDQIERR